MQKAGAGLALAEGLKRLAKIVLGQRPIERRVLPVDAVESLSIGIDGLQEAFTVAFLNPQNGKCVAKMIVGFRPFKWRGFAGAFRERRAIGLGRLA